MFNRLWRLLPVETLRGYEHPELVETVFQKTVAYEPIDSWPDMDGVASVLDFGGACGRHYKEARRHSPTIRWAVVETPAMVARAKELETQQLKFFTGIEAAAAWLGTIDVMHSNGAVQYTPNPGDVIRDLCALRAQRMIWSRLLIGIGQRVTQVSRLDDNGPGRIGTTRKKVVYDRTAISEAEFLDAHSDYKLTERGSDWFKFSS